MDYENLSPRGEWHGIRHRSLEWPKHERGYSPKNKSGFCCHYYALHVNATNGFRKPFEVKYFNVELEIVGNLRQADSLY